MSNIYITKIIQKFLAILQNHVNHYNKQKKWYHLTVTKKFQNLYHEYIIEHIDGLVQERRNSIANALGLRLSCTYPSICTFIDFQKF